MTASRGFPQQSVSPSFHSHHDTQEDKLSEWDSTDVLRCWGPNRREKRELASLMCKLVQDDSVSFTHNVNRIKNHLVCVSVNETSLLILIEIKM